MRPATSTDDRPSVLHRVAAGEAGAAEECLDRWGRLIRSMARRSFADPGRADDATQEVFIHLWRKADRYEPDRGSEDAFVGSLARRRLIDLARQSDRDRAVSCEVPAEAVEAADPLEAEDERASLRRCWARLTDDQRSVLGLSVFGGLSYAGVAEKLGQPIGTVKTRARAGLKRLREAYAREQTPDLRPDASAADHSTSDNSQPAGGTPGEPAFRHLSRTTQEATP